MSKKLLKEIISNIDELEIKSKKLVDREVIKELLLSCPIDLKIPFLEDNKHNKGIKKY